MVSNQNYLKTISLQELANWSVRYLLDFKFDYNENFELVSIGKFLIRNRNLINIQDETTYKRVTVRGNNNGVCLRDTEIGKNIGTKKQYMVDKGQFIISKIDARNGALGIIPDDLEGAIVTNDFPTFIVDNSRINSHFLLLITTTKTFINFAQSCSSGTTNRQRINIDQFLNIKIPLPSLKEQNKIVAQYEKKITLAEKQKNEAIQLEKDIENYLFHILGIKKLEEKENKKGLQFVNYVDLTEWNTLNAEKTQFLSNKFLTTTLMNKPELFEDIFRGKSPKYDENSDAIILNQKCNRWNKIDLKYVKTVNKTWYNTIDKKFFTHEKDVLINSTGNGTIGRASLITKKNINLIYDSHILLLRLNDLKINPLYFTYLFNSSYGQTQVESLKSAQSTNQTELGVSNLRKIIFPLPPIEIQNEIANDISNLEQQIKDLKKYAEDNKKKAITEFEQEIFKPA